MKPLLKKQQAKGKAGMGGVLQSPAVKKHVQKATKKKSR